MKSKFLMGLIILFILFTVTAVSASDNQTEISLNQDSISNDYIDIYLRKICNNNLLRIPDFLDTFL